MRSIVGSLAQRSPCGSGAQLTDELLDPGADLIANGPNSLDALACGIVEDPVLVALARIPAAGVAAAHGDHDVRGLHRLIRQHLGLVARDVDALLSHGGDG